MAQSMGELAVTCIASGVFWFGFPYPTKQIVQPFGIVELKRDFFVRNKTPTYSLDGHQILCVVNVRSNCLPQPPPPPFPQG